MEHATSNSAGNEVPVLNQAYRQAAGPAVRRYVELSSNHLQSRVRPFSCVIICNGLDVSRSIEVSHRKRRKRLSCSFGIPEQSRRNADISASATTRPGGLKNGSAFVSTDLLVSEPRAQTLATYRETRQSITSANFATARTEPMIQNPVCRGYSAAEAPFQTSARGLSDISCS